MKIKAQPDPVRGSPDPPRSHPGIHAPGVRRPWRAGPARRTSLWPLPMPSGRVDPRPRSWSPSEARSRRRGWNQVWG